MNGYQMLPHCWNDRIFRSLSTHAQLLWLFVISHPHTTELHALRGTLPGLAAELDWPLARLRKAFAELEQQGFVRRAADAPLIWFPRLELARPDSPQQLHTWAQLLRQFPDCPERQVWLASLYSRIHHWGPRFLAELPAVILEAATEETAAALSADLERDTTRISEPATSNSVALATAQGSDLTSLTIPLPLLVDPFVQIWKSWTRHCRDHLPHVTRPVAERHLARLATLGVERSVRLLETLLNRSLDQLTAPAASDQPPASRSIAT